jgi:uncharacterized protein
MIVSAGSTEALRTRPPAASSITRRHKDVTDVPKIPRALRALEDDLATLSDSAMTLSQLDGFMAGVLICPELIRPHDWLQCVWGEEEDGEGPVFDSESQMNRIVGEIMGHYNAVATMLVGGAANYQPIYDVDERTGEVHWQMWADGFATAINLRPDAWSELLQADDDYSAALIVLVTLGATARSDKPINDDDVEELVAHAKDVIPEMVERLNDWRLQSEGLPARDGPATKVRRNELCPCGSGKKYKKCCGAN